MLSCPEACGILFSWPGIEPTFSLGGFLTTGPPREVLPHRVLNGFYLSFNSVPFLSPFQASILSQPLWQVAGRQCCSWVLFGAELSLNVVYCDCAHPVGRDHNLLVDVILNILQSLAHSFNIIIFCSRLYQQLHTCL